MQLGEALSLNRVRTSAPAAKPTPSDRRVTSDQTGAFALLSSPQGLSSGAPSLPRSGAGHCRQCGGPVPSTAPGARTPKFCGASCGRAYLAAKRRALRPAAAPAGPGTAWPKAGGSAPRSGRLGSPANNLSAAGQGPDASGPTAADPAKQYNERRDDRYGLHDLLVKVSTLPRIKTCHRRPHEAFVTGKTTGAVAGFGGLQTCGSVWSCSLCAPTVRQTRAAELEAMAQLWVTSKKDGGMGGSIAMATFTVSHYLHQRLSDQWGAISKSWTAMIAGRFKEEFYAKYQVAGMTIAREVTVGDENGWHTHLHVLIWFRNTKPSKPNKRKGETIAPDAARARDLEKVLYERWHAQTTQRGLGAPSRAHGVKVDPIRRGKAGAADIARYVAKVQDKREDAQDERHRREWGIGREMTRGDLKSAGRRGDVRERVPVLRRHRTPFQVLRDFKTTGDANDLGLWQEFEQASLRKRALTWSGTVRSELKSLMQLDERTDEEIAAEDALGGGVVWAMPKRVWAQVVCQDGRRGALLQATSQGWDVVVQLAESWGMVVGRDLLTEAPPRPVRPTEPDDDSAFDQDESDWPAPPCPDWDQDGLPLPEEPDWLDEPEPEWE